MEHNLLSKRLGCSCPRFTGFQKRVGCGRREGGLSEVVDDRSSRQIVDGGRIRRPRPTVFDVIHGIASSDNR